MEFDLKKQLQDKEDKLSKDYNDKLFELRDKECQITNNLQVQEKKLEQQTKDLQKLQNRLLSKEDEVQKLADEYKNANSKLIDTLSAYTSLSRSEAKEQLLSALNKELDFEKSKLIKRYEREVKEEAQKKSNFILSVALARYAGEFATERLINTIHLPDDEFKGKIIGKEGRNIKTFEMLTGVDLIIDDTPQTITISNFNPYRREIALKTLEALIEDGRIQPARIEEIYHKVVQNMEKEILEIGQKTTLDLGIAGVSDEILKLIGKLKYRTSYGQNALLHSIEVAKLSKLMALELGGDGLLAARAGLMHDIGKAIDSDVELDNHIELGAKICMKHDEHPVVINAIKCHHGDEEAIHIESACVCAADALSAARPGARKEVLEKYMQRMNDIEKIATQKFGVKQAFAINAGREVRVIARSDLLDDSKLIVLARDIAQDIEKNLQYPGNIKVNVIRESRASSIAR